MFLKDPKKVFAVQFILISLLIGYSTYWLFLSADEVWRKAIGVYNIIYLVFLIVLAFITLILHITENEKAYFIMVFISIIPACIVCFINRYSRFPDFEINISQFISDNTDPTLATYINTIFGDSWKMYDFIASRSGRASSVILTLCGIWIGVVLYPILITK